MTALVGLVLVLLVCGGGAATAPPPPPGTEHDAAAIGLLMSVGVAALGENATPFLHSLGGGPRLDARADRGPRRGERGP